MKKTFQYLRSYLSPIVIDAKVSDSNTDLYLLLSKGRYMLCADNAVYSYEDKYVNFKKAFTVLQKKGCSFKKVLIMGYGLGSIPILLEKIYGTTFDITGIEIDDQIIDWATTFGSPKIQSISKIIKSDAAIYAQTAEGQYDLIISDVFVNDYVPKVFETKEYLENLQRLLTPEGMILYNRLYHDDKAVRETNIFFKSVFSKTFPDASVIKVFGNWILTNRKIQ